MGRTVVRQLPLSAGRLLVANPAMLDPNFERAVVLLLAYADQGALGVVLNKATEVELAGPVTGTGALEEWAHLATPPAVLFKGGPVSPTSVICVADPEPGSADVAGESTGWTWVDPGLLTVDLEQREIALGGALKRIRVFAGYAGWGPGQLENEVDAAGWWVLGREPGDVFGGSPGTLWKSVLRRQGGRLAMVAAYPSNLLMN